MQKKLLILSVILNVVMIGIGGKLFIDKGGFNRFAPSTALSYSDGRVQTFNGLEETPDNIVFLGDSLTEGGEWSEVFRDSAIINRGINGDSTEGILGRVEETVDGHPKKIFIMAGINDMEHGVLQSDILENYEKILEKITIISPETKIYVQSVLPNNKNIRPTAVATSEIENLNDELQIMTSKYGADYLDLFTSMVDKDGNLYDNYTYDGVHLKAEGYDSWVNQIEDYVK